MRTPSWKVYDCENEYQAACKEPEAAAFLMGLYGDGATIRYGHRLVVWREGQETQPAHESWDLVVNTAYIRATLHTQK